MDKRKKQTHNEGKKDRKEKAFLKKNSGKLTREERTEQITFRCILITIIAVLICTALFFSLRSFFGAGGNSASKADIGVYKNGAYIGGRETDIKSLSEESNMDSTMNFGWMEGAKGKGTDEKRAFYRDKVAAQTGKDGKRKSPSENSLLPEKRAKWNNLYSDIEIAEGEKGEDADTMDGIPLSSLDYWNNSKLRYEAYLLLPQGPMIQQCARNAADAVTRLFQENPDSESIRSLAFEYGARAYEGYICVLQFWDVDATEADTHYWIADIFAQFMEHAAFLTQEEKEHCAWMAYSYSEAGKEWAKKESGVQHTNDLERVNRSAKKILADEFGHIL